MFMQRQTNMDKAILTAGTVLFLLTTVGQSSVLRNNVQTTAAPPVSNSSLATQTINSRVEMPHVERSVKMSCGDEYKEYCGNGGQCLFLRDIEMPLCLCKTSYTGPRCMIFTDE